MLKEHLEFREQNLKSIQKMKFNQDLMDQYNMRGLMYTTKEGLPVLIERLGVTDYWNLLKTFTIEETFNYYYQFYERLVHIIFPICSQKAKKRVDKIFSIVDLKDANLLSMLNSDAKEFLKRYTSLSQNFYPEMLEKLIIINAPVVFPIAWSVVKYWVDKKTRKKIEIYSSDGRKELLKYIDEDKLAAMFGGTCKDWIQDNKGPWEQVYLHSLKENDFYPQIVQPFWRRYFLTEAEAAEVEQRERKNELLEKKFDKNDFLTDSELHMNVSMFKSVIFSVKMPSLQK